MASACLGIGTPPLANWVQPGSPLGVKISLSAYVHEYSFTHVAHRIGSHIGSRAITKQVATPWAMQDVA